jgi:hypothetical protein
MPPKNIGEQQDPIVEESALEDTLVPADRDGTVAETLVGQLAGMTEEERVRAMDNELKGRRMDNSPFQEQALFPQPVTGTIDVARFVTAQSAYIKALTYFLEARRDFGDPASHIHALTQFSLAQSAFIAAQQDVLHQLGVE